MIATRLTYASVLLAGLLIGSVRGQVTHVVGPGGFATIDAAFAAAVPGDIVLVHSGTYLTMILSKGLTVRALTPGTVHITFYSSILTPPGQTAHLVGLDMNSLLVRDSRVTLDQCTWGVGGNMLTITDSTVHLQDCVVSGVPNWFIANGQAGVVITDSEVTAISSRFEGADELPPFVGPTRAIEMTGSIFRGSGLVVSSGQGAPGVPALTADTTSTIWLSDSIVSSDPSVCPILAPVGRQVRCTLSPNCGALPTGSLLGVERVQPPSPGAAFALTFHADPGGAIGVFANRDLGYFAAPLFEQSILLGNGCWGAALLVADALGDASVSWNIPAGPTFVDRALWFQGFAGMLQPLQVSPIAGGVVR